MERIKTGFKLLAQSGRVVRKEPGLLVVMGVGFVLQIAVFLALFWLVFQRSPEALDFRFPRMLWAFPIMAVTGIIGSLTGATVVATAMQRLEKGDGALRDGFALAVRRFPKLVAWNFFAAAVGLVIQLIAERLRLAGKVLAAIGGVAWAVATMLVIPVLLFEERGILDSLGRSASLIKKRWGEGVTGVGSMGVALVIVTIPLVFVPMLLFSANPALAVVVMWSTILLVMLIAGTLGGVFSAALYRFAADGTVSAPFHRAELEGSFTAKEEREASPARRALRLAGFVFAGLYVGLMIARWLAGGPGS